MSLSDGTSVFIKQSHPLKQRHLAVTEIRDISSGMRRITLQGDDLDGFYDGEGDPEAHVKLFFPRENGEIVMPDIDGNGDAVWVPEIRDKISPFRDYTIRFYDAASRTLEIDFVKHNHGTAGSWAMQAERGDILGVLGPRSSSRVVTMYPAYLLLADDTAAPALARWLTILPPDTRINAVIETESEASCPPLPEHPGLSLTWLFRKGQDYGSKLSSVEDLPLTSETFLWVAGEASAVRDIRKRVSGIAERPAHMNRFSAYWKKGRHCYNPHAEEQHEHSATP